MSTREKENWRAIEREAKCELAHAQMLRKLAQDRVDYALARSFKAQRRILELDRQAQNE